MKMNNYFQLHKQVLTAEKVKIHVVNDSLGLKLIAWTETVTKFTKLRL